MSDFIKPHGFADSDLLLKTAIDDICRIDEDFKIIEILAGELKIVIRPPTFASIVRIIVGQQLSAKAADSIFLKLNKLVEILPKNILSLSEPELRAVGLSRAKIACCQSLAMAILEEKLGIESFSELSNQAISTQLLQIKGIGKWTVEIFLLFCLNRLDTLPANDLAIQSSYQKLKNLPNRPTAKEHIDLMATLEPNRGAAAHLLWHYYRFLHQKK